MSASIAAHALVIAWALSHQPPPPLDLEQKPIIAKLVRLGQKRPEQWLPRKEAPPSAPPPPSVPAAVPVPAMSAPPSHRPAAPAPHAKPSPPTPAAPAPPASGRAGGTSLASIMSKVQKQADAERWGDPNGSAAGDSDTAEGNQYLALVDHALRANYVVPVTISERERLYLEATIILWLDPDGRITRWQQERPSGNPAFDAAVERTLRATPRVPPPPSYLRDAYRRTGIKLVFQARQT